MITFSIIGAVAAGCCILVFIWGIARWIIKITENTAATDRLTQTFQHFVEKVGSTLEDHGTRITRLETKSEYYESGAMKSVTRVEQKLAPDEDGA